MMKKILVILILIVTVKLTLAQVKKADTLTNAPMNAAQKIVEDNESNKVTIGAYAQIDYNQQFNDSSQSNGNLDVHRMVLFVGYKFNNRTHFVSEMEMEHHVELELEQAFLNYQLLQNNQYLNFRAGLMVIPMGIINEYHEPLTFNGVERPMVDTKIVPTTWRELGAGFLGNMNKLSLRYQLYIVNGFQSYNNDDGGILNGSLGYKKGRQEVGENTISSPGISSKIDFYGVPGLKLGISGYYGKTQSTLYDNLLNSDVDGKATADSSILLIGAVGLDARYNYKNFEARGELLYFTNSNSFQYNKFTQNDIGEVMIGYYAELGYNVLGFVKNTEEKLIVFGRYEFYDTNFKMSGGLIKNDLYAVNLLTMGLTYKVSTGAAFKADYQLMRNQLSTNSFTKQFNLGIGIWF